MSEEPTSSSSTSSRQDARWLGWLLALIAVPVLYVLAIPPVFYGVINAPPWLRLVARPYVWAMENTFLRMPLTMYADWWLEIWASWEPPVP